MIGGLQPCSFIDYPGHLCTVVFLQGCNLRCPYCHNPGLVHESTIRRIEERDVLSFLASRRGRLNGVVITGGEPTLHPRLRPLIEAVRALGFKVKLDTNGTRPRVLEDLLDNDLLDYVAMDLKDDPESYPDWLGMREAPQVILRSIEVIKASGIDHELRTTVVLPHHDSHRLDRMAKVAAGSRRWVLQPYRPGTTLLPDPPFRAPMERDIEEMAARICVVHGVNCRCRWDSGSGQPLGTHYTSSLTVRRETVSHATF